MGLSGVSPPGATLLVAGGGSPMTGERMLREWGTIGLVALGLVLALVI